MATSSIKKNFVINSKKSAVEIAKELINIEQSDTPTLNRKRIAKPVLAENIISYFSIEKNAPSFRR